MGIHYGFPPRSPLTDGIHPSAELLSFDIGVSSAKPSDNVI